MAVSSRIAVTPELLSAICDRPDDVQLRLVAADWCEERGELDRANFIRTECALDDLPRYRVAWQRHRQGWQQHELLQPRPVLPDGMRWAAQPYRRGFPEVLDVFDVGALLANARDIFAAAPVSALE